MGMGGPSAQNVAEDLQRQVTDANSALRRGAITCYAEDIYIPPKQGRPELLSVVVSGIIVAAVQANSDITLATVLVVSLVGFVGTVALGRFVERRGG